MTTTDYLKIGSPEELHGRDRRLYRALEALPAVLSWGTLVTLAVLSYFQPVWMAYFLIAFDVYWLLLVIFLGIHLIAAYRRLREAKRTDWHSACAALPREPLEPGKTPFDWTDIIHLVIFPVASESYEVIRESVRSIASGKYPGDRIILLLAIEARGGERLQSDAQRVIAEFGSVFRHCHLSVHPDGIVGELKGKGANQAWAAAELQREYLIPQGIDRDKVLVSVFDIDTIVYPDYFYRLTHAFLTVPDPYHASYQPVPVYHNNVWQAPFFARVAASSNTFWQMMQQIRQEKLATYSSHSMTWRALSDIGFWSRTMVSEDSRIFWHCFCFYRGRYRVEPLHYPVSMDVTMDRRFLSTAKSLYKQQRRWGWGVENIPYLIFNTARNWNVIPRRKFIKRILVQLYGFHSWGTNALIIGVVGWLPLLIGGERFTASVLSTNLPFVSRTLMMLAMSGLVLSAILSTVLLPPRPKGYGFGKQLAMIGQWLLLPVSIIFFGAIPGLEAQTRLALGGKFRLGFFVTPKER